MERASKARLPGLSSQASARRKAARAAKAKVPVPVPHLQAQILRSGFGTYKSKRWFCLSLGCVNSRVSQRTAAGTSPRRKWNYGAFLSLETFIQFFFSLSFGAETRPSRLRFLQSLDSCGMVFCCGRGWRDGLPGPLMILDFIETNLFRGLDD